MLDNELRQAAYRTCDLFKPYNAIMGEANLDKIRLQIAYNKRSQDLSNDFSYYCELLGYLRQCQNCVVRQLKDLYKPLASEQFALSLRHDIDIDPFCAVMLSRALYFAGLTGSFYILHTADYYGRFINEQFVRHRGIVDILRSIQDEYRCELGLHTDGLWIYQKYGFDGAQAIYTELAWLREQGINIKGTVAHNSAPVYGGENFEVFEGRALFNRYVLEHQGQRIPVQTLSEAELGLTYEGNYAEVNTTLNTSALTDFLKGCPPDPSRDEQWMRTQLLDNPYCRWGVDYNIWLVGVDRWVIAGHQDRDPLFIWQARLDDVRHFLSEMPGQKHMVCHIHPFYLKWADEEIKKFSKKELPGVSKCSISMRLQPNYHRYYLQPTESNFTNYVTKQLLKGDRVLHVGCGGPYSLWEFWKDFPVELKSVVGLDISEKIREVKERFPQDSLVASDTFSLPLKNSSFDVVIVSDLMHYIPEKYLSLFLEEVWRVLAHHGRLMGREAMGVSYKDELPWYAVLVKNLGILPHATGQSKVELKEYSLQNASRLITQLSETPFFCVDLEFFSVELNPSITSSLPNKKSLKWPNKILKDLWSGQQFFYRVQKDFSNLGDLGQSVRQYFDKDSKQNYSRQLLVRNIKE